MGESKSIHPRHWGGAHLMKVDTSKSKSKDTKIRTINAVAKYCEANPRDAMAATRLSKLKAAM